MNRDTQIILCNNIKIDKQYKNVLTYNTEQMIKLCQDNAVYTGTAFSFIRPDQKTLKVEVPYNTALRCNYMAFQNEHYSLKWFFCFIDSVEYRSDNCCYINFTVDAWSTWFDYWDPADCFIIREHTDRDIFKAHTVPEDLECGEYRCNEYFSSAEMDNYSKDLCYIMASTSAPVSGDAKDTIAPSGIFNGIYTGLTYYRYDDPDAIDIILEIFAKSAKTKAINGIFMAPKWLCEKDGGKFQAVKQSNAPKEFYFNFRAPDNIFGYVPRNQKVLTYPYRYLLISNNIGQNNILHYEKFGQFPEFKVKGCLSPGCSIQLVPQGYNGLKEAPNEAITLGKFPICNFQNDMYTNWLTQNSVNVLGRTVTTDDINVVTNSFNAITGIATSIASHNAVGAISAGVNGGASIAGAVMQKKQHNMIPATVEGQLNSADVNVASGNNTFHFYQMSVKAEFAEIIDDYFDRFGYATNRCKKPNMNVRESWDYLQIGAGENLGYYNKKGSFPVEYMNTINEIARAGVTMWHDHAKIGNYKASNKIVHKE